MGLLGGWMDGWMVDAVTQLCSQGPTAYLPCDPLV